MSASTWRPEPPDAGRPAGAGADVIAAAVLVALCEHGGELQLILTRRRDDLRSHAGEISFPGGRQDPADADLAETALREAEEEIGLARSQVNLLGQLPPTSTLVTGYVIHPFVGTIPAGLAWTVSEREVDAVLELSLREIRASHTRTLIKRRGFTFETDAYVVGEEIIWGATARIIENLLARLAAGLPGAPMLAP